ncbi:CPBP family intramembrane glutamic endopeptidase [Marinilabilia rubra]|uniref:CPBP family intramembrane metalloprotease domain-containing protein n=1 Tax=Marinilabilia rubra TaxID=2162893 RepID=A0A2U2B9D4_9BACT|nr:CPBP family intramembrane glutamic endopeptidase [Marinilabilia rubra]PWD99653.1 CPBP family intramembrane metalloprotease domain-containing protein [Marinilabilia rubra]
MKAMWSHQGGFTKLVLFFLLVFTSFAIFSLLAFLAAFPFMENVSLTDAQSMSLSIDMMRYFQIVQSFSVFIIPSLLAGFLFWGHMTKGLALVRANSGLIVLSLLIIISAQPLVSYLGVWNSSMQMPDFLAGMEQWMQQSEDSARDIIYRFLDTDNSALLFINILMIAILPALGEEMLFRGVLQPIFREWLKNKHLAILITAFLFSAIHLQFFTFLPRFFLGIALGYLMVWGHNLWYPIAGHFANNFLSLIVFYYYRHTNPEINPLSPETEQLPLTWLFIGSVAMIAFTTRFFSLKKQERSI